MVSGYGKEEYLRFGWYRGVFSGVKRVIKGSFNEVYRWKLGLAYIILIRDLW